MNTCPQTIDSDTPCANSTIGLKSITIKEEINNLHTQCLEWLSWLTFQTTPLYGSSLAIRWFELGQRPFLVYFMQHALLLIFVLYALVYLLASLNIWTSDIWTNNHWAI